MFGLHVLTKGMKEIEVLKKIIEGGINENIIN